MEKECKSNEMTMYDFFQPAKILVPLGRKNDFLCKFDECERMMGRT
jgi:hypothetical protein